MSRSSFLKQEFIRQKDIFFVIFTIFAFSLLRIPSLIEPDWYGDEGIYQVIGMALRHGRLLYKGIWDNKPPILYLIYALFNGDQFWVRLFSLFFGIGSILVFFLLAKKLFVNRKAVYISTGVFAVLFGLPLLEGNIANAENFMLLPILLAFYLVLKYKTRTKLISVLAGVALSAAFLTKIVALFDFAALLVIIFILQNFNIPLLKRRGSLMARINYQKIWATIRDEIILIAAFVVPIVLVIAYFVLNGAFADFFRAVFSQNVGYVGYGNTLIIPQGLLILKLLLLASALSLVFWFRKTLAISGTVIFVYLVFSLFDAFFSGREYTHYLLMALPAFSLFIGYLLEKKQLLKINIVILIGIIILISRNFTYYNKTVTYYKNYSDFLMGRKTLTAYQAFFDSHTPRDYELARFVTMNTPAADSIFLWSDSGQIYALAGKLPPGRYIVAYHMTFYKDALIETKKQIDNTAPKYLIDTKHSSELIPLLDSYTLRYKISDADIYERQP